MRRSGRSIKILLRQSDAHMSASREEIIHEATRNGTKKQKHPRRLHGTKGARASTSSSWSLVWFRGLVSSWCGFVDWFLLGLVSWISLFADNSVTATRAGLKC